jgi:hypothetical protein
MTRPLRTGQLLNRLRKKSGGTGTLGCAHNISAAKTAQARVPVPLQPVPVRLFPQPVKPHLFCELYGTAEAAAYTDLKFSR